MNKIIVKKIAVVAATMMCMSTAVVSAYASPVLVEETERQVCSVAEKIRGDVNGDGKADFNDISIVASHVKGIKILTDISAADLNGDGLLNIKDVTILSAIIKGVR